MGDKVDNRRSEAEWTRREFLKLAGAGAAFAALGGAGVVSLPRAVLAGPKVINLNFTVWSYSIDTIQDNINKFQTTYNNAITVKLNDVPWPQYHETMVNRLSSKTALHVLYNGGDWLPEFARAGWVVPLEDYLPRARTYYAPKIVGYALQDMTYNGKMYGLPYYADITTFQYNAKLLKDKGVANPPTTWEELTDQAKFLRGKGIESPMAFEFAVGLPTTYDNFTAMMFGRGGEYKGQYGIAKRWAVEKGLGFGQLPLVEDADVKKSFGQWIDFAMFKLQASKARARRHAVWEGIFGEFARVQLVRAISGEAPVDEAIGAMAQKVKELRAQFK